MTTMPWGKHRGQSLDEIPSSYLAWVLESCDNVRPSLRQAIADELEARFGSAPPPPPPSSIRHCPDPELARSLVAAGQRALAKKHHPDVGGETRVMQAINNVRDWFLSLVPR